MDREFTDANLNREFLKGNKGLVEAILCLLSIPK